MIKMAQSAKTIKKKGHVCIDCGTTELETRSIRCSECFKEYNKTQKAGMKKRSYCAECGIEISANSKRCRKCSYTAMHKPTLIVRKRPHRRYYGKCADCGGKTSTYHTERCRSCRTKKMAEERQKCERCGAPISNSAKKYCWNCYKLTCKEMIEERGYKRRPEYCNGCGAPRCSKEGMCRTCRKEYFKENHKRSFCLICGIEIRYRRKYCNNHIHDARCNRAKTTLKIWQKNNTSKPQRRLFEIIKDIDSSFVLEGDEKWHPITVSSNPFRARKPDIVSYLYKIVVEFDGEYWHKGSEWLERWRDEELRGVGYVVLHFNEQDLLTPKKITTKVKKTVKRIQRE